MQAATERARKQTGTPIALYRNNVDGKGSCWGTHENYMMPARCHSTWSHA